MIAYGILALVIAQRLLELACAHHNTRRLLENGAMEIGRWHYPLFVILHGAWLAAIALAIRPATPVHVVALAAYAVLEMLRLWTMLSLGRYWTTRIITLPGAPLVRRGPYRLVRHPNYLIVVGEIVVLPLVFGEIWIAAVFSILNALLLFWRIREEEAALAPRRSR